MIHGIKSFGIDLIWEKGSWLIWKEIIRNVKHHVIIWKTVYVLLTLVREIPRCTKHDGGHGGGEKAGKLIMTTTLVDLVVSEFAT